MDFIWTIADWVLIQFLYCPQKNINNAYWFYEGHDEMGFDTIFG